MKQKRKGAYQGYQLLKKKSDALTARFRGMLKQIVQVGRGKEAALDDLEQVGTEVFSLLGVLVVVVVVCVVALIRDC